MENLEKMNYLGLKARGINLSSYLALNFRPEGRGIRPSFKKKNKTDSEIIILTGPVHSLGLLATVSQTVSPFIHKSPQ